MKQGQPDPDSDGGALQSYRVEVRALIERYGWAAVDEQTLVTSIAAALRAGQSVASPKDLVIRHYTRALYKACDPHQAAEVQERAYVDLFAYLYRVAIGRYRDSARELAQRALELTYHTYEACNGADTFLAFAAMKLRQAHTELRRAAIREHPLDNLTAEALADPRAAFELSFERESQARALYLALARLPEPMRLALHLKYVEELSDEEIAERLHTSPVNVRKLRSRGLTRLRDDALLRREVEEAY